MCNKIDICVQLSPFCISYFLLFLFRRPKLFSFFYLLKVHIKSLFYDGARNWANTGTGEAKQSAGFAFSFMNAKPDVKNENCSQLASVTLCSGFK